MKIIVKDGKHYLQGRQAEVARVLLRTAKKDPATFDFGWTLSKQADDASVVEGRHYRCEDCSCEKQELEFKGGSCPDCGSKRLAMAI